MKFRIPLFSLIVVAGLLSGCAGYQLGDVKPSAYQGIHSIHVPTFKNLTLEPRLSSLVTNAVLSKLQSDGTYKVATRANSDAVLVGTIQQIRKHQLRAVRTDTLKSQELSLYLYVAFHLEDPVTGKRIDSASDSEASPAQVQPQTDAMKGNVGFFRAQQGLVIGETIQFVDPSFQVGERSALSVAAEDAADKIVAQLANGW